jgi:5-methyltetrahydrofolate--homocysteine methyltransferase
MGDDPWRGRGQPAGGLRRLTPTNRPELSRTAEPMTRTVIESKSRTTVIGFDQPFCVIGERINPTGRKILNEELERGDFSRVESRRGGAGRGRGDGARRQLRRRLLQQDGRGRALRRQQLRRADADAGTDPRGAGRDRLPAVHRQLGARRAQAGLEAAEGRPLVNSVTGEEERLEVVLPLVKKYNVAVVAISNDDTGISEDPDVRFAVAKKIVERAADFGIPPMTSWSIRWSCRSAPWRRPASRSSPSCAACARSWA